MPVSDRTIINLFPYEFTLKADKHSSDLNAIVNYEKLRLQN
ncbi:hypothetical protein H1P_2010002 [Hyella patelloides LEGE 07179]|uniref:Uncharacterized protein n=1 Tax=Hyella patelloides LEGE 07179 TaxID=945734 RepID=A0A563VQ49_9CYAN|nr:hypothetical protein H1P_2010002 [Hyella patelloides LEGE 07179]